MNSQTQTPDRAITKSVIKNVSMTYSPRGHQPAPTDRGGDRSESNRCSLCHPLGAVSFADRRIASAFAMTSASLTKSSNINFLIWCLMAIVAGSLSFLPNRYVCIAYSCGYLGRLVSTPAHRLKQRAGKVGRVPDQQETHLRHTRKESPIARHGNGLN